MPRRCSICNRVDRELVDAGLASGETFRAIGGRFGLALGTVHRHVQHAQRVSGRTLEDAPEQSGESVIPQLDGMASEAERALAKPDGEGHEQQPPTPFEPCSASVSSSDQPAIAGMNDVEREQHRRGERARALELLPKRGHHWDHRCRCGACGVTRDLYRRNKWPCVYVIAGTEPIEAPKHPVSAA
jgi:hypothetical protein